MSDALAQPRLLELDGARIATRGGAVGESLTFAASGPRLVLVGRFAALLALLSGEAALAAGRAFVLGCPAEHAVSRGVAGLALLEPVLPSTWTAERYLVESAELSGYRTRDARKLAFELLERFELAARARHQLKDLLLTERRALILAGATIGNPRVLIAEAPLARVDQASQHYLARVLERAAEQRFLIVSVPELAAAGAERGLVDSASDTLWEHPARAPGQAEHGGERVTVAVLARGEELCRALSEQGIRYQALPVDPVLLGLVAQPDQGIRRLLVELPAEAGTAALLRMAHAAGAPVAELVRHV